MTKKMMYWKNITFIALAASVVLTAASANANRPDYYNRADLEHVRLQPVDSESTDAQTPEFVSNSAATSNQPQPQVIQLNFVQEKENDQISSQSTR